MRLLSTALLVVAALIVIGLAVMYSGAYNVAASTPHSELGRWMFRTTMENSVRSRAEGLQAPAFTDAQVGEGAGHYTDMCEGCHGAPGVEPGEIAKGMRPAPPDLAKAAGDWNAPELFWIIKHGIKMTGMPAWGEVDSDDELWKVVAFVQAMPDMSAERYQTLKAEHGGAHHHDGEAQQMEQQAPAASDSGHGHDDGHAH